MKILIINQYLSTHTLGGHDHRHGSLAQGFVQGGEDVLLITSSYSHVPPRYTSFKGLSFKTKDSSGADIIVLKTLRYHNANSVFRVLNWVIFSIQLFLHSRTILRYKPTHIIVSSLSLFPILVVHYCWKRNFKFILEIRDIWPLTYTQTKNKDGTSMFERLLFWIEGVGLRSADLVVGLMPFYNNYAKDRAIDIDHKYLWVSNGIHMDLVRPNHELNYINQEKVRIVYAGSLGIINKIELLLEAVAKLNPNQFELIIAGSGPKVDEVQAYASQYRHITFLGRIKSNEVGGILYRSDIAYLGVRDSELYKYGLSPNKLFDYMNQGIPILYCSNYPAGVDPDNEFMLQCKSSQVDDVVKILQDFKKMPLTKREAMKLASKKAGMRYNYSILSKKYLNALSCI